MHVQCGRRKGNTLEALCMLLKGVQMQDAHSSSQQSAK